MTEFAASLERMLAESNSGELSRSLYEMGCSAETLQQFRPDRIQGEIRQLKAVGRSMTLDESRNPDKITDSRCARIASGCGVSVDVVRKWLAQFRQMSTMMQTMSALRTQR